MASSWIERPRISVRFAVLASSVLGGFLTLNISARNARLTKGSVSVLNLRERDMRPTNSGLVIHAYRAFGSSLIPPG
jgi:hypothetical protein